MDFGANQNHPPKAWLYSASIKEYNRFNPCGGEAVTQYKFNEPLSGVRRLVMHMYYFIADTAGVSLSRVFFFLTKISLKSVRTSG